MTPMLTATGVTRRHRSHRSTVVAVDDVSLSIAEGQRVGIVGESGSGKTTLLRLLAKLDRPDSGSINYRGRPLDEVDRLEFCRAVQPVFQDPASSLDPRMRIGRIVAEPLACLYGRSAADSPRVVAALARVGLDDGFLRRYPRELSGGQRQRVAIARALVSRPRVLLADEPVSALDPLVRDEVLDLLTESFVADGLTAVVVTHDLAVAARLCDTLVVMQHGRVVERGPTADVLSDPRDEFTARLIEAVPRLP